MFSAINDARLAVGKGPIGFINPTVRIHCLSLHVLSPHSAFVAAIIDLLASLQGGIQ